MYKFKENKDFFLNRKIRFPFYLLHFPLNFEWHFSFFLYFFSSSSFVISTGGFALEFRRKMNCNRFSSPDWSAEFSKYRTHILCPRCSIHWSTCVLITASCLNIFSKWQNRKMHLQKKVAACAFVLEKGNNNEMKAQRNFLLRKWNVCVLLLFT